MKKLLCLVWTILYAPILSATSGIRHLTVTDGLPNNEVRQIIELPNRQLLVATEGYFSLYNGHRFVPVKCNLDSVQHLPSFGGHDFLWQGDSILWIKDYYYLYLFDTRTRCFKYDYDRHPRPAQLLKFITEDSDTLAMRRREHLTHYTPLLKALTKGSEIAAEHLQSYIQDYQGGQWFGLRDAGILYQPPTKGTIQLIDLGNDDVARHMVPIDRRQMLVSGDKGIYIFNTQSLSITQKLMQGPIHTTEACADGQGRIWVSTNIGLFCYYHGQLQNYNTLNVKGFEHPYIRFAIPVDRQRFLVCNYMHDLGYFYPDERRFTLLNTHLPQLNNYRTMIVATALSNKNQMAVCTQNGFFVLDTSADTLFQIPAIQQESIHSRKYNCILHDRIGHLWVGTQNGLLLQTEDNLRRITRADGLPNECIQSLVEDEEGNVWVGTANGVGRIQTGIQGDSIRIRNLTTDDGLPAVQLTERGICLMPDSMIYLATPVGMVAFRTTCFQGETSTPTVEIVGLNIAGQAMPLDPMPLTLSYQQNYINLQVSTLDYAHPHRTRYRYRLMELEDGWHTTPDEDGRISTIQLTALPPGRFTVEVQASIGDDIWGPSMQKTFIINPPLWLTWWAKLLYILLSVSIFVFLMRWYLRDRQQRMQRENERRINELFELREEASRKFAQSVEIDPERLEANSKEQQLIKRLNKAIGENLSNPDYTVDALAQDVGMSRANLYKKMQTTLGITPNDFLRNMRLKRATELLAKSDIPVNQLALQVGFQTPRYFSQCFHKAFGLTPSEYREGKKSEE